MKLIIWILTLCYRTDEIPTFTKWCWQTISGLFVLVLLIPSHVYVHWSDCYVHCIMSDYGVRLYSFALAYSWVLYHYTVLRQRPTFQFNLLKKLLPSSTKLFLLHQPIRTIINQICCHSLATLVNHSLDTFINIKITKRKFTYLF